MENSLADRLRDIAYVDPTNPPPENALQEHVAAHDIPEGAWVASPIAASTPAAFRRVRRRAALPTSDDVVLLYDGHCPCGGGWDIWPAHTTIVMAVRP